MTLPQNVADAVKSQDQSAEDSPYDESAWQTIRAHLMSREAEISNLRADRDSWLDQASQRVEDWDDMRRRAESAESRLAAANALLRDIKDWDVNAAQGTCLMVPLRLRKRIQSHLQGAGDEA